MQLSQRRFKDRFIKYCPFLALNIFYQFLQFWFWVFLTTSVFPRLIQYQWQQDYCLSNSYLHLWCLKYSEAYKVCNKVPLHMNFQRCEHVFQQCQAWVKLQLALCFLLLMILQLYHLPPPLPPPITNSSCLFNPCMPAVVLYYCTFQGTALKD